jgi:hypothetical protein
MRTDAGALIDPPRGHNLLRGLNVGNRPLHLGSSPVVIAPPRDHNGVEPSAYVGGK